MNKNMSRTMVLILFSCLVITTGFAVFSYSERNNFFSQLQDEKEVRQYWQSQYVSLNNTYQSLVTDHSSLESEHALLEQTYQSLLSNYTSLLNNHTMLSESYMALRSSHVSLQEDHESLESNYTSLSDDYSSLQNNYTFLTNDYLSLSEERNSLLQNLTEALEEKEAWITAYNGLNSTYTLLLQNYTEALDEIRNLNQMIAELEGKLNFTNFETLADLEEWLAQDDTSEHEYIQDEYDCDDFAHDLMVSAFKSGYKIETATLYSANELYYIDYDGSYFFEVPLCYIVWNEYGPNYYLFGNHVTNLAYVEDTGWVLIEPQTDWVFPLDTYEL